VKRTGDRRVHDTTGAVDQPASRPRKQRYTLRLYVTGLTPRSTQAVATLRGLCEEYLAGCYHLEIIDIYQQPELVAGEEIIAVPTLVKELPLPLRRLVGDLSNGERILVGLNLCRKPTT
jgi:circadian clock protein KaiB